MAGTQNIYVIYVSKIKKRHDVEGAHNMQMKKAKYATSRGSAQN